MTEEQLKEALESEKLKNKELATKLNEVETNFEKVSKKLESFESLTNPEQIENCKVQKSNI